jgi:dihydrodipicolinate synthase/N-acetylneuraminate lyase
VRRDGQRARDVRQRAPEFRPIMKGGMPVISGVGSTAVRDAARSLPFNRKKGVRGYQLVAG